MYPAPGTWYINPTTGDIESKCGIVAKPHCKGVTDSERKANAHLIAAAPDLLEACKAALECCKQLNGVNPQSLDKFSIDTVTLERAIDKATSPSA